MGEGRCVVAASCRTAGTCPRRKRGSGCGAWLKLCSCKSVCWCASRNATTGYSPGRQSGEPFGGTEKVAKRRQERLRLFDHSALRAYQREFLQSKYRAIFAKPRFELLLEYVFTQVDSDETACRRVATKNKLAHPQPRIGIRGYRLSSLQDYGRELTRHRKSNRTSKSNQSSIKFSKILNKSVTTPPTTPNFLHSQFGHKGDPNAGSNI
jgi:hypothetical protein